MASQTNTKHQRVTLRTDKRAVKMLAQVNARLAKNDAGKMSLVDLYADSIDQLFEQMKKEDYDL